MSGTAIESHMAVFTVREAERVRSRLCEASLNARTKESKGYLSRCAASVDSAMAIARGASVEVYGTLGFLRFIAAAGGQEVIRSIERQLVSEPGE